jgi:HlyD family secretion protein
MKHHPPPLLPPAPSGAAMDRRLPPRAGWRRAGPAVGVAGLLLVLGALLAARFSPAPLVAQPQLATVQAGEFRDELLLRARVEPLRSVTLDAAEAGRVEAVLAHDGDVVAAGALLYRLYNPEHEQQALQRRAEVAQQMANLSAQRSAQATSLAQHRRERAQLQAALQQAEAELARTQRLAAEGFVAPAALEQAQRQQALTLRLLQQAEQDQALEAQTREQALAEMAQAVQGLQSGLLWLAAARERLAPRAPMAGQLSGLQLQVGMQLRAGDRLGRIDDPEGGLQLVADVDEFHLPRLQPGLLATSTPGALGATSPAGVLVLAQTLPQVRGGLARVQLRWRDGTTPAGLRAGQAVEVALQLARPAPALLLADGPGVREQLYVRQGHELQRRAVRLGRRAAGRVEVLTGLQAGDEVLISNPPNDSPRLRLP